MKLALRLFFLLVLLFTGCRTAAQNNPVFTGTVTFNNSVFAGTAKLPPTMLGIGVPSSILFLCGDGHWRSIGTVRVSSVVGTAGEIDALTSGTTVTLSLPASLTLTGKLLTGGTFVAGDFTGTFNGPIGTGTPALGSFLSIVSHGTVAVQVPTGGSAFTGTSGNTSGMVMLFATSTGNKMYLGTGDQILGTSVSDVVLSSVSGNVVFTTGGVVRATVSSTGITAALIGNASTATALQNSRNINGVAFNGTANITVTADASTLTGTTLNSGVTVGSLGRLTNLSTNGYIKTINGDGTLVTTSDGTFTSGSLTGITTLALQDTGSAAGRYLYIVSATSTAFTTSRQLTIDMGDAHRTLTFKGDPILMGNTGLKRVTSDVVVSASTTLVDITGLSVALEAGKTYSFRASLQTTHSGTGGYKVDLHASGGLTATALHTRVKGFFGTVGSTSNGALISALSALDGGGASMSVTGGGNGEIEVTGTITVGVAGTMTIQGAQQSASSSSTYQAGSFIEVLQY